MNGMLWAEPKKRARRHEDSLAVRAWFCSLTACHPDWSFAECIRSAKRIAPELFQGHIQTLQGDHSQTNGTSGLHFLRPDHVTELVDLGQRISESIFCGSSVFALLSTSAWRIWVVPFASGVGTAGVSCTR